MNASTPEVLTSSPSSFGSPLLWAIGFFIVLAILWTLGALLGQQTEHERVAAVIVLPSSPSLRTRPFLRLADQDQETPPEDRSTSSSIVGLGSCTGTFSTSNPFVIQPCLGPCGNQTEVLAYLDSSGDAACPIEIATVSCTSGTCVCTREDLLAALQTYAASVPFAVAPVECGGTCDQAVRGDACQFGCPVTTVSTTTSSTGATITSTVSYTMFGAPNVTCGADGLWLLGSAGPSPANLPAPTAPTAPVCVPTNILCPAVTPAMSCELGLAGTGGTCVGAENGDTCKFTCRPGFALPVDDAGSPYDSALCAVGPDNVARWTRPVGCIPQYCAAPGLTGCGDCF